MDGRAIAYSALSMLSRAKKEREGKERYTKSQVGYISPLWAADPFGPISTKIGTVVGVDDVIILSKFGFNILMGFRSIGGQNFHFPIDFAGLTYLCMTLSKYTVSQKKLSKLFLSELCQISTNCENFWHRDSREDKLCEVYSFSTSPNFCQRPTV